MHIRQRLVKWHRRFLSAGFIIHGTIVWVGNLTTISFLVVNRPPEENKSIISLAHPNYWKLQSQISTYFTRPQIDAQPDYRLTCCNPLQFSDMIGMCPGLLFTGLNTTLFWLRKTFTWKSRCATVIFMIQAA